MQLLNEQIAKKLLHLLNPLMGHRGHILYIIQYNITLYIIYNIIFVITKVCLKEAGETNRRCF